MSPKDKKLSPDAGSFVEKPQKQPSSFEAGASRVVRWLIIVLLVLIVGYLVIWVTYLGPRAAEVAQLQTDLAVAQGQNATLEADLAELQNIEIHFQISNMLMSVNLARFEIVRGNMQTAEAALTSTSNGLTQLRASLGSQYDAALNSIQERLDLAKLDIQQRDEFAALNDLEVLANSLLNLEADLFSR